MATDFQELRTLLPARAEADVDLHRARLKNELREMIEAHRAQQHVHLLRIAGRPPWAVRGYDVILDTAHLVYTSFPRWLPGGEVLRHVLRRQIAADCVAQRRGLPVRVELSPGHPDRNRPPIITLLDHRVVHPAVLGPAICYADAWDPTMFLPRVLAEVAALLRFERAADLQRPLNPQAARWVSQGHPGFELPIAQEDTKWTQS
jgi:hypothetical protein